MSSAQTILRRILILLAFHDIRDPKRGPGNRYFILLRKPSLQPAYLQGLQGQD